MKISTLATQQIRKLDYSSPLVYTAWEMPATETLLGPSQRRLQLYTNFARENKSILNLQMRILHLREPRPHDRKGWSSLQVLSITPHSVSLSQESLRFISFNRTFEQDTPRLKSQKAPMGYPAPLRLQRLAATCLSALTSNALLKYHPREGGVLLNAGSDSVKLGRVLPVCFANRPPGAVGLVASGKHPQLPLVAPPKPPSTFLCRCTCM